MSRLALLAWGLACVAAVPLHVARAQATAAQATVSVGGAVATPRTLSRADLLAMPRATLSTSSGGIAVTYEGVWVADVLRAAGVGLGASLRGASLATYVVASASDGYRVLFSLGELDPELSSGQYLLADTANGQPLFGENGAFRLVVATDKRGARSVRLLSSLQVVSLPKP